MDNDVIVSYDVGTRSVAQLTDDLAAFWQALRQGDATTKSQLEALGLDPADLNVPELEESLVIGTKRAGTGVETVAILVTIKFGHKVALDLWQKVILPRLQHRYGVSVVGKEQKKKKKDSE